MPAPGTIVERRDGLPAKNAPITAGRAFMAGLTDRGSVLEAVRVTSLGDFVDKFGPRVSYSVLYDTVDTFFHEGGSEVYISRVVGPAPVTAVRMLNDNAAAPTLQVRAKSPGEWGNLLRIAVLTGGSIPAGEFQLQVSTAADGILETSPNLVDKPAALAWALTSKWIDLVDQASALDPVAVAATGLQNGADDRTNVTDTQRVAALNRFMKDHGPGQVGIPGATTSATQQAVLDHANSNGRVAILDATDTPTVATLTGLVAALRNAVSKRERFGGLFAPWDVVPGLTPGSTRVVPPSGRIMGACSRLAAAGKNANVAAAGDRGQAQWAIGLSQPRWSEADRETLNNAGINVSMMKGSPAVVTTMGWRSLADPAGDANWIDLGNSRLFTEISAQANQVGDRFVFEEIDGEGRVFRRLESQLKGMLLPIYAAGSLYGASQADAFVVDVGPSVNTPESIAAREIRADLGVRISPHGELVRIRISRATLTEKVS